jgi:hypothetical protein
MVASHMDLAELVLVSTGRLDRKLLKAAVVTLAN